jgi:hypothetical protein
VAVDPTAAGRWDFLFVRALAAQDLGKHAPKKAISKNKYLFNITI